MSEMQFLDIETKQREALVDIGPAVREVVRGAGFREGLLHLWSMHTTCALTVNENADPHVARDMVWKLGELVPRADPQFRHAEGNSDAHLKTSLFGPGLTLIIHEGEPVLGTWQGIFLCEWDGPRTRRVAVKFFP